MGIEYASQDADRIPMVADPTNNSDSSFGSDPSIQLLDHGYLRVDHKAKYRKACCSDCCDFTHPRKYFWVFENSIEVSRPFTCALFSTRYVTGLHSKLPSLSCCVVAPNCCCTGSDYITKSYFDREEFDMQSWCWKCKFVNGAPTAYPGERGYTCCCMPCCSCYNQFMGCYFPFLCGERVRMSHFQNICWCLPNKSDWYCNFCNLCGITTGEPLCLDLCLTSSLADGEAKKLAEAINRSRSQWTVRTNQP